MKVLLAVILLVAIIGTSYGGGYGGGGHGGHGGGHSGHGGHGGGYGHSVPTSYKFSYGVNDPHYGPKYSHSESGDGKYRQGYYSVKLPDGRTQHVKYNAGGYDGFNAQVTYSGYAHGGHGGHGGGHGGHGGGHGGYGGGYGYH